MKKLQPPKVHNLAILKEMKTNTGWAANPHINESFKAMRSDYIKYQRNKGSAFFVSEMPMGDVLKAKLIQHFDSPRADLSYIEEIRFKLSPNCCPTCGGEGTFSVDHYLPKASFPNLTLYSLNLVPACDCNFKRSSVVRGLTFNETAIHPYFDDGLDERIMKAEIIGSLNDVDIDINFIPLPCQRIHIDKIRFHITHVINRSRAKTWMIGRWATLVNNTNTIITTIPEQNTILTHDSLKHFIDKNIIAHDDEHKTPNNWKSIFLYGIRESNIVIDWLVLNHNNRVNGLSEALNFDD